jgi:hypothetical protein
MYTPPWIPRADAKFQLFAQAFCNGINNDPPRYMMVPAQAQALMQALDRFNDAFMIAINPATRTRGTIIAKDDARSILRDAIRSYAAFIRPNKGISDEGKIAIGVPPRNVAHNRRKCPQTSPLLHFIGSTLGFDVLRFSDWNTPNSKAKPYGAAQLELYVAYSLAGEPRPKKQEARYVGPFTKNPIRTPHDAAQEERGARPTYWARWRGHDGQIGEWSLPASLAIAMKEACEAAKKDAESKTAGEDVAGDQPMKLAA